MSTLRDILRESDLKLHEILLRNWEHAWDSWLPALDIKKGSYNSYPHLRNLEQYLDILVLQKESTGETTKRIVLSPVEIYVLLSSVLFHDIGNIKNESNYTKHGKLSQDMIVNYYREFGIPSLVIAKCIGRICEYHDSDNPNDSRRKLRDIIVNPYGLIREVVIATLLSFVDMVDSAYTRVLPEYLLSSNDDEIVGAFRRFISGVLVDFNAGMVRVSLNKDNPESKNQLPNYRMVKYDKKVNLTGVVLSKLKLNNHTYKEFYKVDQNIEGLIKRIENKNIDLLNIFLPDKMKNKTFTLNHWYVARQIYNIESTSYYEINPKPNKSRRGKFKPVKKNTGWPPKVIAAVVMGDVKRNGIILNRLRDDMVAIGMPIQAWLIECQEHLFNQWGEETYEPIFSKDYLIRIVREMWALSTKVFGTSLFSYENLAAAMREQDINKIKLAVRRIALVTQKLSDKANIGKKSNEKLPGTIWIGHKQWKWHVEPPVPCKVELGCSCIAEDAVINLIKTELKPPYEQIQNDRD